MIRRWEKNKKKPLKNRIRIIKLNIHYNTFVNGFIQIRNTPTCGFDSGYRGWMPPWLVNCCSWASVSCTVAKPGRLVENWRVEAWAVAGESVLDVAVRGAMPSRVMVVGCCCCCWSWAATLAHDGVGSVSLSSITAKKGASQRAGCGQST